MVQCWPGSINEYQFVYALPVGSCVGVSYLHANVVARQSYPGVPQLLDQLENIFRHGAFVIAPGRLC
jgi:hypothetical protein